MSTKSEDAVRCFSTGCNCAQAVFSAYCLQFGVGKEDALKISTGFGAGMARMQEVCGAVTGAIMVIGCAHGMTQAGDTAAKEETYRRVQEFARLFREKHGALTCKELIGCDLNTEEGRKFFQDNDLHNTKCAGFVHEASDIVGQLIPSAREG
ncbi:MAG: C-GCAxxG-C-C family protein [Bacteroidota bacterium]